MRALNHAGGGGGEEDLQIRRSLAGLRAETPELQLAESSRDPAVSGRPDKMGARDNGPAVCLKHTHSLLTVRVCVSIKEAASHVCRSDKPGWEFDDAVSSVSTALFPECSFVAM